MTVGLPGNEHRALTGKSVSPTSLVSSSGSASCKLATWPNDRTTCNSELIKATRCELVGEWRVGCVGVVVGSCWPLVAWLFGCDVG